MEMLGLREKDSEPDIEALRVRVTVVQAVGLRLVDRLVVGEMEGESVVLREKDNVPLALTLGDVL